MSDMPNLAGLGNMEALLEQAQAMKSKVDEAQEQLEETVFTGSAGGGKVTIDVTGKHEFKKVTISPEAVDVDDLELLEELVLAALHDATSKIGAFQKETMGDMGDMGALGGMLGQE